VQKQGARIYDLLVTELQTNISAKVRTLAQQVGDSRSYMAQVDGVWGDHVQQLNTIRNIFLYLDRYASMSYCRLCLYLDRECALVRMGCAISRGHSVSSLAPLSCVFYVLFVSPYPACHRGCSVTPHMLHRALTCLCLSLLSHFVSGVTPCSTQA
jgi:hypothetical protein